MKPFTAAVFVRDDNVVHFEREDGVLYCKPKDYALASSLTPLHAWDFSRTKNNQVLIVQDDRDWDYWLSTDGSTGTLIAVLVDKQYNESE